MVLVATLFALRRRKSGGIASEALVDVLYWRGMHGGMLFLYYRGHLVGER